MDIKITWRAVACHAAIWNRTSARARVSEIVNCRRPLTLRMIQELQAGLGIPAEVLIQPYELAEGKSEPQRPEPAFEYRQRRRPPQLSSHTVIAKD